MKQIEFPTKHRRGSLPQHEIKNEMNRGISDWMRRLRSVEGTPEDSLIPPGDILQHGDHNMELTARDSYPSQNTDDEGRWQDDGGECG
jgi:hypothetical protein